MQAEIPLFILIFILGAAIGSFLNVVAYRLPKILFDQDYRVISGFLREEAAKPDRFKSGIPILDRILSRNNADQLLTKHDVLPAKGLLYLATPASSCPNCGHKIRAYENIPVLGWLFLRGKCSGCHSPISVQYPLVELFTGLLTVAVIYVTGLDLNGALFVFFMWILMTLSLIDLKFYVLPDQLTLPLMWLGLLSSFYGWIHVNFQEAFLGAIVGYLSLWFINQVARLILRRDGMGNGDFKLLAALGAWLGLGNLFNVILLSSISGAVVGIAVMMISKNRMIPYGPFLALAALLIVLFGIEPHTFFYLAS
ncbi:prepilin peptidase [Wohlfahrtiimonas chitiniclastica]|uniref:prepilin peptidase n=1 Tax=Wohlfahrtiimonas chitiniclastica TaxID=400946 RepID=UPI001BD02AB9|nr:A24 family peptidase [Wohlfahrtiimonas chitiniclastica]